MSFLKIGALVFLPVTIAAAQNMPQQTNDSLRLSPDQKAKLAAIKADVEKKGAPVALHFAEVTKQIYENMLKDVPDEQLRMRLSEELRSAASSLLAMKGESIWAAVGVLTAEQKASLRSEMRTPGAPSDLTELIDKLFDR